MGLPLYTPPVKSDLPLKSAVKSPADPAHARSSIRRGENRRRLQDVREHRLRMLSALQARDYNPSVPHGRINRSISRPADGHRGSGRQSPRFEDTRIAEANRRLAADRRSHDSVQPPDPRDMVPDGPDGLEDELNPMSSRPERSDGQPRESGSVPQYNAIFRYRNIGYAIPGLPARAVWRRDGDPNSDEIRYDSRRHLEYLQNQLSSLEAINSQRHTWARYNDGLGDRERSLSPDEDGVWDTLQSTLTPDPQPPSVGSSFASTVVSNTTRGNEANSVSTSLTTPNEEMEPPCDPILDNPTSDAEDDTPELLVGAIRRGGPRRRRRTYAHVAAEPHSRQSPEATDTSDPDRELLSGMHRIVRGLASRGDIPDEWWLQAGLSRSMSWEE
ncbi:hypothetical protein F4777DRAFT_541150 [Nemania sp. FL0916]|nr:hypothetical protein F4777DRAFT_541150 [Nemania sp. FL0916]